MAFPFQISDLRDLRGGADADFDPRAVRALLAECDALRFDAQDSTEHRTPVLRETRAKGSFVQHISCDYVLALYGIVTLGRTEILAADTWISVAAQRLAVEVAA